MSQDAYDNLAEEVSEAGFFTNGLSNMGTWQRTCVCSKFIPGYGYTGNSFWVSYLNNDWYLGTWGGWVYRLPETDRIAELCIEWLTRETEKTLGDFDETL